ncbi:MAG: ABC transporter permease subunit [bacterium]|nr:ABC transporter permease subunit [bacterium]
MKNIQTTVRKSEITAAAKLKRFGHDVWEARFIYLILLPGLLYFLIFQYGPMGGLVLAFKKFNAQLGIWGSKWVGMQNFQRIFATPAAITAIKNTFEINLSRLVFQFPVGVILAIFLSEMRGTRVKRIFQTVFTFPHFLSWITVSAILTDFFSNGGAINTVLASLGMEKINFLSNTSLFRPLLYFTHNWKEMGWNSIIFLAAIVTVDPTLHEAATVDGANRFQRIWHVTLPGIKATIITMFILEVGRVMNAGFEQIFYLQNAAVKSVSEILDTYVYSITFQSTPSYGFSTAVGMFKAVINLAMLATANFIVKKIDGKGMFG